MSDDVASQPGLRTGGRPLRTTRPLSRGLLLAGGLAAVLAVFTWVVAQEPGGHGIDLLLNRNYHLRGEFPLLHMLDRVGQRAVCLPVLGAVIAVMVWRHRSLRPLLVGAAAVLSINMVVLVLKVWLGRGAPLQHQPQFWIGGQMFPSGHTSNIVAVYGVGVYLLSHYGLVSDRVRRLLNGLVVVLGVIMTVTSLVLHWHWFTDLIAGFLIGGVVLAATVAVDAAIPFQSRRLVIADPTQPILVGQPVPLEQLPPPSREDLPSPLPPAPTVSQRTSADS